MLFSVNLLECSGKNPLHILIQDVSHLWELGGGTMYTNLIETPLVASQLPDTTIIIMIDLSKPELIWSTLISFISSIKVSSLMDDKSLTYKAKVMERRRKSYRQRRIAWGGFSVSH